MQLSAQEKAQLENKVVEFLKETYSMVDKLTIEEDAKNDAHRIMQIFHPVLLAKVAAAKEEGKKEVIRDLKPIEHDYACKADKGEMTDDCTCIAGAYNLVVNSLIVQLELREQGATKQGE